MEGLLGIFGKLLKEESHERIDVLGGVCGGANRLAAVRVSNVDGLVKEDDGRIAVPRVRVVDNLNFLVDGRGAELEEKSRQG